MAGVNVTVWAAVMVTVEVVTVPVVATEVEPPPSMCHEAILYPVPPDRL